MPNMDGTGPTGQGAGTGRGMGACVSSNMAGGTGFRPRCNRFARPRMRAAARGQQRPMAAARGQQDLAAYEQYLQQELQAVKAALAKNKN